MIDPVSQSTHFHKKKKKIPIGAKLVLCLLSLLNKTECTVANLDIMENIPNISCNLFWVDLKRSQDWCHSACDFNFPANSIYNIN